MVVPKSLKKEVEFTIFHIPQILYEGLRREYAVGAVSEVEGYTICELDKTRFDFNVCIGVSEDLPRRANFCIWSKRPSDVFDFSTDQLFSVSATQRPAGAFFGVSPSQRIEESFSIRFFSGEYKVLSIARDAFLHWVWGKTLQIYRSEMRKPERSFWKQF